MARAEVGGLAKRREGNEGGREKRKKSEFFISKKKKKKKNRRKKKLISPHLVHVDPQPIKRNFVVKLPDVFSPPIHGFWVQEIREMTSPRPHLSDVKVTRDVF